MVLFILFVTSIILPITILHPFKPSHRFAVGMMVLLHLLLLTYLHHRLVEQTGYPIVLGNTDPEWYYENTKVFSTWKPFSVTIRAAQKAADEGGFIFGYQYVLGTLWTVTEAPALAMRYLKTLILFSGLAFLARVWRVDFGDKLAFWGVTAMALLCHPAFYYNWRNRKDGLLLGLFLCIMAVIDTLLRPKKVQIKELSNITIYFLWAILLILLGTFFIMRPYTPAMILLAVIIHAIVASKLELKRRLIFLSILILGICLSYWTGLLQSLILLGKNQVVNTSLNFRGILQAILSPIPWGILIKKIPSLVFFYTLYWLSLPYVCYCFVLHLRMNMTWHFFLYIMIGYVVAGAIGDPPRKRLIVYPILVHWILLHLAILKKPMKQLKYLTRKNVLKSPYLRQSRRLVNVNRSKRL